MEIDFHGYRKRYENAIKKLKADEEITKQKTNSNFLSYCKIENEKGISIGRIARYSYVLMKLAKWLGKDFDKRDRKDIEGLDEVKFQKYAMGVESQYSSNLRVILKNKLPELNDEVSGCGTVRYKIHLYSFKKFPFTIMADTLGEMATRAIKGDSEYLLTYYRKSREEKVEYFKKVIPKLLVFSEPEDTRKSVEDEIKNISKDDLVDVLKFLRNGKTQFSESAKIIYKEIPVEKLTGSFNKITNLILINVRIQRIQRQFITIPKDKSNCSWGFCKDFGRHYLFRHHNAKI